MSLRSNSGCRVPGTDFRRHLEPGLSDAHTALCLDRLQAGDALASNADGLVLLELSRGLAEPEVEQVAVRLVQRLAKLLIRQLADLLDFFTLRHVASLYSRHSAAPAAATPS